MNSLLKYCFDDIRSGCSGSCGRAQALQSNVSELSSVIKILERNEGVPNI